jgi:hypothetical protein
VATDTPQRSTPGAGIRSVSKSVLTWKRWYSGGVGPGKAGPGTTLVYLAEWAGGSMGEKPRCGTPALRCAMLRSAAQQKGMDSLKAPVTPEMQRV